MRTLVFLLRGINVGGSGRLPMATLRETAEDLGMADVRTYIQSGNLVARWDRPPAKAAAALRNGIETAAGFAPGVLVRSADQLRAAVVASPYPVAELDPKELHVTFLDGDADRALRGFNAGAFAPERVVAVGRELHLHLPGGIGRSRLAAALVRTEAGADGSTRNWRTVTTLADLADDLG